MWFEELMGFPEGSPEHVRQNLVVDGETVKSQANGMEFRHGNLEIPTLADLRVRREVRRPEVASHIGSKKTMVREVVADVKDLHADVLNAGALFQVASQFNLLEMISPNVTPEQGISRYEHDYTQGPACAVAAGAGTIYRNYFADVNGQVGQTAENQIDCLADLGTALGNEDNALWDMKNGYALASADGLNQIAQRLNSADPETLDDYRGLIRCGIQQDTQVTIRGCSHLVNQIYCSALPVAYSPHSSSAWEPFARLVLDAAYEATLCTAAINAMKTGKNTVYLTLLGGGAFGNETEWIIGAIDRALKLHADSGLDIRIVSYGSPSPQIARITTD